jgi:hypothetical protein
MGVITFEMMRRGLLCSFGLLLRGGIERGGIGRGGLIGLDIRKNREVGVGDNQKRNIGRKMTDGCSEVVTRREGYMD